MTTCTLGTCIGRLFLLLSFDLDYDSKASATEFLYERYLSSTKAVKNAPTIMGSGKPMSSAIIPMISAPNAGPPLPITNQTLITLPLKLSGTKD